MQHDAIAAGETIWVRQQRWRVERARRDRDVVRIELANRTGRRTFWLPFERFDRLAPRLRLKRRRPRAVIARLAPIVARAGQTRTLPAVIDARLDILPHQLEPALAIFSGARRVLLADEVGLGKTLQAAIVIAELVRREPASRVLVIVPAPLVTQWAAELRSRFGLSSRIGDRDGLDAAGREAAVGEEPWRRSGIWIATLDFLKQPHVIDGLPAEPWNLAVIDEAHGAGGRTDRHAAADRILRRARRVLLLTATPHSGDDERFERLLQLGALMNRDAITIFRRSRTQLGLGVRRRVRWPRIRLSSRETAALDALVAFERAIARAAAPDRTAAAALLLSVFRKRALSTMAALAGSLERRAAWLDRDRDAAPPGDAWRQPTLAFGDDEDDDEDGIVSADVTGLETGLERRWLKRLIALARAAAAVESKLAWIVRLLARSAEPVIVFTEFRRSLETALPRIARMRTVAVVHGSQRATEREANLAAFLEGRASVLIATDVAGQGLNLQHRARWVINLELPWNPARLEQRAGRVDRIGQTRAVHVTSTVARHDAETGLLARLSHRVLVARCALGHGTLSIAPPAPGERALAEAMFLDVPLSEPEAVHAPVCTRWQRPGRWIARTLERRRRLAGRWRGGWPGIAPVMRSDIARLPAFRRLTSCCLIFVVPIVDGAGLVLESRVVAVSIDGSRSVSVLDADLIAAAGLRASRACAPRARRLARAIHVVATHEMDVERALAEDAARRGPAVRYQPGLFDRRAQRQADATVARRDAGHEELARQLETLDRSTRVAVGQPSLVAVLMPSR